MTFLHVMRQITLLLCRISSIVKSRNFGTLICVLISFWILSFYSRIVQGFSPKVSPKVIGFSPLHFGEPVFVTSLMPDNSLLKEQPHCPVRQP